MAVTQRVTARVGRDRKAGRRPSPHGQRLASAFEPLSQNGYGVVFVVVFVVVSVVVFVVVSVAVFVVVVVADFVVVFDGVSMAKLSWMADLTCHVPCFFSAMPMVLASHQLAIL